MKKMHNDYSFGSYDTFVQTPKNLYVAQAFLQPLFSCASQLLPRRLFIRCLQSRIALLALKPSLYDRTTALPHHFPHL